MNKTTLIFVKSHLKKAIYNLETANKLVPNSVDSKIIEQLKIALKKFCENA